MKIKILIIRHGQTIGNEQKQYIGKTDQPLSAKGVESVEKIDISGYKADCIFTSPMKRCIQTAQILFKDKDYKIIDEIRETDFGEFEEKDYETLKNNANYIKWLELGGRTNIHKGESTQDFSKRTLKGFERIIEICTENKYTSIAIIAHGGTIMSLLDKYSKPHKSFYNWQIKNANGYCFVFDTDDKKAENITKLWE